MLLGVFPMICFDFLRSLEENRKKKKKTGNWANTGSFTVAKGTFSAA